jgi:molecular chaperone GrpE
MSDRHEQTVQKTPDAHAAPGAESGRGPGPAKAATPPTDAHERDSAGRTVDGEVPPSPGEDRAAAEIKEELDELVKVGAQRDEYLALAQRTQADFENFRKRVARESALASERGITKLTKELLPALDNLDRALDAADQHDPLLQGVRLVREELAAALARVGVESFSPAGEQFDPAFHEAIAQHPVEGVQRGSVAEVYQPGYRLGEQIIRPARVVVAA